MTLLHLAPRPPLLPSTGQPLTPLPIWYILKYFPFDAALDICKSQISLSFTLPPSLRIFRPDDWLCYWEGYFEGSEAFSDLDKQAWLICNVSHEERQDTGNTSDTPGPGHSLFFCTHLFCALFSFHYSSFKFKLWSEIILHTKIYRFNNSSAPLPLLHFACLNRVDLISGNLNPPICLLKIQNTCLAKIQIPFLDSDSGKITFCTST